MTTKKTLVAILLSVLFALVFMSYCILSENTDTEESTIDIQKGSSLSKVAAELHTRQLISSKPLFILLARLSNQASNIKAGEYRLPPQQSMLDILTILTSGKTIQYQLTIVEGWSIKDVILAMQTNHAIKKTLDFSNRFSLAQQLKLQETHPEGLFFPDTYFFPKGISDTAFLRRAYTTMQTTLQQEWQNREKQLPLKTPYEALILASIIEKETGIAEERKLIAGVFINRLRKGMRLQTDPTVIYGLGDDYDGDIRFRDLRTDTPYNTYTRYGLPPTPIAMPGKEAINAALHPEKTDALYFVASGNGKHHFSATLAEHEAAVDRYQRNLR